MLLLYFPCSIICGFAFLQFPLVCLCYHCRWMTSWCDALKIVWWRVSSCILAFGWWLCNNLGKQSSKYSLVPLTICYELPEPYARMKQNVVTLIVVAHKILLFLQSPLLFITNWLCKSFEDFFERLVWGNKTARVHNIVWIWTLKGWP